MHQKHQQVLADITTASLFLILKTEYQETF